MYRTLRILLTDRCNLGCVYCCHEGIINDFSILTNRNITTFIQACSDVLNIKRIKFTGGEPLLYDENISDIVNKLDDFNLEFSIVTNGTHSSKLRKLLEESPNIEVTVSLPVPPIQKYKKTFYDSTNPIKEGNAKRNTYDNILETISYLNNRGKPYKINYVLCNSLNVEEKHIKEMIDYASKHPQINLRFLETISNKTNNKYGELNPYIVAQKEFDVILSNIGYSSAVKNKIDKRSSSDYILNGCSIKFIKAFCYDECAECPEDKTSLWLSSMGYINKCSYRGNMIRIDNWNYYKIAHQLEDVL